MPTMGEGQTAADLPRLPAGFLFGTSTASYQIEGAATEGGKGPSIWDTFTAEPGRILDASSGAVACDHYHRYREDVALMARLGAEGYRFSIAWPRIQPTGSGHVNAPGLEFYDRLVDELLGHGIAPMATLYHWDLPQALETASNGGGGGWLNRDTALRFGEYAAIVADRLADRVAHWCPVNEPNVASLMGYALGMHAPGKTLMFDAMPAAHHLLLGHGLATQALRAAGAKAVGTANNHAPIWPATDSEEDKGAAELFDAIWNRVFADPMLLGRYPEGFGDMMGSATLDDDLAVIRQPLDFYGVNYYNPMGVRAAAEGADMPFDYSDVTGYPKTDFGWPVVPDGLRELLVLLKDRYPGLPPVMITENGCSYGMGPDEHGVVDDEPRIEYLDSHLRAVADAIAQGVDVRGYYCWSLMDNFEWSEGYTQRFGLVHVDFETQARTPKRSFDWYAETVRANR
jgi:beta-glucosidase